MHLAQQTPAQIGVHHVIYEKSIYLSCEGLLFFLLNDINYHSYIKTIMAVKNIWQGCELNDQTF
ncbi:hypothetical protein FQF18_24895 [Escherichia coli]|nr:hypothetical protein [Escherichia coli]EFN5742324.1 hypothetical protein [Escherichia coli]EFN5833077.1 hypothetical protein [Escherichia coli]